MMINLDERNIFRMVDNVRCCSQYFCDTNADLFAVAKVVLSPIELKALPVNV